MSAGTGPVDRLSGLRADVEKLLKYIEPGDVPDSDQEAIRSLRESYIPIGHGAYSFYSGWGADVRILFRNIPERLHHSPEYKRIVEYLDWFDRQQSRLEEARVKRDRELQAKASSVTGKSFLNSAESKRVDVGRAFGHEEVPSLLRRLFRSLKRI